MTHADIIKKFMIEYDKADITTSFPSLTKYEIATILDKAYFALIAQKFTGANPRRAGFESDAKAIEDVRPLITRSSNLIQDTTLTNIASNEYVFSLPQSLLYFIEGGIKYTGEHSAIDDQDHDYHNVIMVPHTVANKYKSTATNMPWVKDPVCYLEDTKLHVLVDPYLRKKSNTHSVATQDGFVDEYIEPTPSCFVVYLKKPTLFTAGFDNSSDYDPSTVQFELNEQMAEELVSLAIVMSLEIVESSRLNTKINTLSLEP